MAQNDTIVLNEVIVSDTQLKKFSNTKYVSKLNDSIISRSNTSLTSLLNYNSTIYFKENGLGMVSSPSFRGTTAQQTAVIWNGININSQLNGLTDFNTINNGNYNEVTIRAGGGSAIYGSSAIGGSIHLSNALKFEKEFSNALQIRYGSFNTLSVNYALNASTERLSSQFSIVRNNSDNDYKYLNTNQKNQNGQFENTSANLSLGYKINPKNYLKFYSQVFDGLRHFSGTLAAASKSKYEDWNTRSLLEYANFTSKTTSNIRLAFLTESYKYFEDKNEVFFNYGKSETTIAKYDFSYQITDKITLNSLFDYTHTKGFGSDLKTTSRDIFSGILLMKHQLTSDFLYEINLRKEITSNYQSPYLFSFGTNYSLAKYYKIKMNVSKNFRIPTFNDLYWQQGGNPDLNPESALQFDVINEITTKNLVFTLTGFYNKIKDMISWKPNSNGLWQPINTNRVNTYGIETSLGYNKRLFHHHVVKLNLNYGYTISENQDTGKQLIYVPQHKLTSSVAYNYRKLTVFGSHLFNGAVFTSLDNYYRLKEYNVVNLGIEYQILKYCRMGFQVQNLANENYQAVIQRPLPGRNYILNFNFNL
ncbi:TonB-dependent receptor plug domain-containing protein [Flavobacterium dankookense]|uniref:Iron complex outermembrane receptor protein n=1 Tax=Flavobacterium dankookense TaxID=706186 RepID=A0A4R6QDF3_9FLAO|nr:TonB-dependent receptor [Flavobacterium dankookense]TDP59449.1 iron complex outermembrane receptor protein [Flavobacterium dankookense]